MSTELLHRAGRRFLLRHPWQTALAVLGIAAGVAAVAGIDLTSAGAERAFALSVETVAGPAGYEVARDGGDLDEAWYVAARRDPAAPGLVPVLEGWAAVVGASRRPRLFGIDPLAAPALPAGFAGLTRGDDDPAEGAGENRARLPPGGLMAPDTVLVGRDVLPDRAVGEDLDVRTADGLRRLRIIGRLAGGSEQDEAFRNSLIVDIATAQELLGRIGRLSRIDVLVPATAPATDAGLAALRASLPTGTVLRTKAERTAFLGEMTAAFRLNLQALSWLALLVGAFLVYSTMSFTVLRRRAWIGLVRALGVQRREVGRLVIAEALLIGALGTALGLVGGALLSRVLMGLVLRTIDDLYFAIEVREATLLAMPLIKSAILGVVMSAIAALLPAWEAMRAPPRKAQLRSEPESRAARGRPLWSLLGLVLVLAGCGLTVWVPRGLGAGFLAVLLAVLGAALLVPAATIGLMRLGRPMLRLAVGALGNLAARGVVAGLSRTGVALSALVVATAAATGIGIMVHSFRETVIDWLDITLQADFYASDATGTRGDRVALPPTVVDTLRATTGVGYVTTSFRGSVGSEGGPLPVLALDADPRAYRMFRLVEGRRDSAIRALVEDDAAMIGVPMAYRLGLGVGDVLPLDTRAGRREVAIVGVFDDFGSDRGTVVLARPTYERLVGPAGVHAVGIYAAPGADRAALGDRLTDRITAVGFDEQVTLSAHADIRELSLTIFDRTFEITHVLRLIAVLIAFAGVVSALLALELDRLRERAVLRALGLTPRQLGGLVTVQNVLMGLCAGVLAAPVGIMLAWFLVHVINRRAFGWTLHLSVPPSLVVQGIVMAVVAAALAGWMPARRSGRQVPAQALREE